jgi:heme/copper-type cytochrome/quinol oxidase subunit 3
MAGPHRAARACRRAPSQLWTLVATLLAAACVVLRWREFDAVHVGWDENAYGSIVWGILVMHLIYLVLAVGEGAFAALTIALYGLDDNLVGDIEVTAIYWYWVAGAWLLLYAVVFWAPRIL